MIGTKVGDEVLEVLSDIQTSYPHVVHSESLL